MEKNNNSPIITVVVAAVVIIGFAYFISTGSTKNPAEDPDQLSAMNNHHGGSVAVPNIEVLNSLVGEMMPDIELTDKDGNKFTSADFKGKNTVLFFNEGLMCYPACWNQISAFGSDTRFNKDDIQAISVVVDSAKDWQTAIKEMPQLAKAKTMFDTGASASRKLGMLLTASSMHRGQLPGHTYILIGKDGKVSYVLDDPNMAIANDLLYSKIKELK
ncbi:MAG: redoxin family protein [Candidatus Vogelbacteria bacterium]|nr:redoxin family protein [Candidatus Vogelbacteria bacterium]